MNPKKYDEIYDAMWEHAWALYKINPESKFGEYIGMNLLNRIGALRNERIAKDAVELLGKIIEESLNRMNDGCRNSENRSHFYWIAAHASRTLNAILLGFKGEKLYPLPEVSNPPFKD